MNDYSLEKKSEIVWLDLGDLGELVNPKGPFDLLQDHGLGLLRTILHQNGVITDLLSTRSVTSWDELREKLKGYKMLIMNIRSYTFPVANKSAQLFKELNPDGIILTGGMHATVSLDEMTDIDNFDRICSGPGENVITDLVKDPLSFPRVIMGVGAKSMAEWPIIDRSLWPQPHKNVERKLNWPAGLRGKIKKGELKPLASYLWHTLSKKRSLWKYPKWPIEPNFGWGPNPMATTLTSRVCPWQCVFCNENSYINNMGRKPVDMVIEELNYLDNKYGISSVAFHDSMFFQNPAWLKEWLDKYPRKANKVWPYWAAARSDTVRHWPDLFEALVRETNWSTISIGFESGSDRILKLLNKECTEEDNSFTIELVNRLGDEFNRKSRIPPKFWTNIILAIPGETHEDAFKTMRMIKTIRYAFPSISYYAPYPGSVLGYQLIAEGKSLMTKGNYHRFSGDEKVKGIDYQFYRELLNGKYDDEINRGLDSYTRSKSTVSHENLIKA